MKISELRDMDPGTPLTTADGGRVAFAYLARDLVAPNKRRTVAVVDTDGRTLRIPPRSLRPAPVTAKAAAHPETLDVRKDLADHRHTITVERVTRSLARDAMRSEITGTLAVIERHNGRFAKLCAFEDDLIVTVEQAARGAASTYGAEYIPAAP